MNSLKIFRALVFLNLFIFILMLIKSLSEFSTLPEELYEYYLYTPTSTITIYLSLISLTIYSLSLILLLLNKKLGKNLFFISIIIVIILNIFTGPAIYDELGSILLELNGIVTGMIIVLFFFSPIKEKFS